MLTDQAAHFEVKVNLLKHALKRREHYNIPFGQEQRVVLKREPVKRFDRYLAPLLRHQRGYLGETGGMEDALMQLTDNKTAGCGRRGW